MATSQSILRGILCAEYREPADSRVCRITISTTLRKAQGWVCGLVVVLFLITPSSGHAQSGVVDDILLGIDAAQQGDFETAIRLYTQALISGELQRRDQATVYYNRAIAFEGKGDTEAAIADFTKAIRMPGNDDAAAYSGRARLFLAAGRHASAIKDFSEAILLSPRSAVAYNNRGVAYAGIGENEFAAADFEKALRLSPDFADARRNLTAARRAIATGGQLVFGPEQPVAAPAGPTFDTVGGTWSHTQASIGIFQFTGEFTLPDLTTGPIRANYTTGSSTGSEPGLLIGRIDGHIFAGKWVTLTFGTPCETKVEDRPTWGKFKLEFNANFTGFTGNFGICDGILDRVWTGERTEATS
jgi:tetratricopeptide (TPR) repeat protein